MIKAPLAKGVGGVALAFRDRLGPGQPVEDKMSERFEAQGGVPFNLALPPVEGIHAAKKPFLQHQIGLRVEITVKRVFHDFGLGHARHGCAAFELGMQLVG